MNNDTRTPATPDAQPSQRDRPLPHDRDEKPQPLVENAQHRENRKPIDQARKDVEAGIQDTERIGTPNDVPSSGDNRGK